VTLPPYSGIEHEGDLHQPSCGRIISAVDLYALGYTISAWPVENDAADPCLPQTGDAVRQAEIFLRTLLFTTATKGRVIENMFLRVHQPIGTYVFDFWGHTESGKLTLGSGLFVGATGVASDHHFNSRHGSDDFIFHPGAYRVEVFGTTVGKSRARKLMEVAFNVNGQQAAELVRILNAELFLFWNADTHAYEGLLERSSKPA